MTKFQQKIANDCDIIIAEFYELMPFSDSKLFYCDYDDKVELIEKMERVTAIQCALLCVNKLLDNTLNFDDNTKHYYTLMIEHLKTLL